MKEIWQELLEIHFAVGADTTTLYSILGTVAQTLAATTGFSIAFVLLRFPAMESQLKAIDEMLIGVEATMSRRTAWDCLIAERLDALEAAFKSAASGGGVAFPTRALLQRAHEQAGPLIAHWSTVRRLFHWTMMVNALVIITTIALIPYIPWLAKDSARITATCAFALSGGVIGIGLSFGLANVLVRTKRITPYDPPTI